MKRSVIRGCFEWQKSRITLRFIRATLARGQLQASSMNSYIAALIDLITPCLLTCKIHECTRYNHSSLRVL